MPVNDYFKGVGDKVLGGMQDHYGKEKGEKVFYATANKRDMTPTSPKIAKVKKLKDAAKALKG